MKKLNYLWMLGLLVFAAVNFSACSSDDDDAPGSSSDLIGLWEEIYSKGWEKENGEIDYEYEYEEGQGIRVEFKSDGTFAQYDEEYGGWELDLTGIWEYKGGKIYVTFYDEYDDFEYTQVNVVKELTSSRLVVESTYQETYEGQLYEGYGYSICQKVK